MKNFFRSVAMAMTAVTLLFAATSCGDDDTTPATTNEVERVELNKATTTITVGKTETLKATVFPEEALDKTVTWTSDNETVATVTEGVVEALSVGEATITVTTNEGDKTAQCVVTVVTDVIPVTNIEFDITEQTIAINEQVTITANVTPDEASDKTITWASEDNAIASVVDGLVTGVGAGSVKITATANDGSEVETSCLITVEKPKNVYAVGSIGSGFTIAATLWKNGEMQIIGGAGSEAKSVYVSGDDVYVAGFEPGTDGINHAMLWKNGEPQVLSTEDTQAMAVFVHGSDVYVAGRMLDLNTYMNKAVLWKNGEMQTLSNNMSFAYSVYVSDGGDVYVAGTDNYKVGLWKNGEAQTLATGNYSSESMAVFVSGNDVYVGGDVDDNGFKSVVWKNGEMQVLTQYQSYSYSVFVEAGDVYVAGILNEPSNYNPEDHRAVVYKNGEVQVLSDINSQAAAVYVSDGDVYVAGRVNDGNENATIWKNGEEQTIGGDFSRAYSIFVK